MFLYVLPKVILSADILGEVHVLTLADLWKGSSLHTVVYVFAVLPSTLGRFSK